jgi:gliding motility-associated-like protein
MTGGSGAWEFSVDGTNWYHNKIEGLTADIYMVQIRDANHTDCLLDLGPYEIKQPPQITAMVTPKNVSCYGGIDGTITISNPKNGVGPYQYSIDGGTTWKSVGTFTGLKAGTYNLLIIQDANSCTATLDAVEILQPEQIEATAQHTNETLPDANDGTITVVNQAGGSGIYIYSLDGINWQSQSIFTGLAPGTYDVYVGDGKVANCYITLKVIILPAGTISANYTVSPVTCFGGFDGSITFVNVAGAAKIEFSIDGGGTWFDNPNFAGLSAQEYALEIRDKDNPSNAVVLGTVEIKQPMKLDAVVTVTNETFSGAGDGKIIVSGATGGSGFFEYSKDGLNWQSGNEFAGLTSGTYDIYIRDKNAPSCSISIQKVINPAGSLQADVARTDVLCKGDNTGVIMITNASGATKYNYSVNGGTTWVTTSVITGLAAGTYDVRIQDAGNPANTAQLGKVVVREPDQSLSLYAEMHPPLCHDGTGKLIVAASGGTPPYTNTGTYTIPAGKTQTIIVKDANGCTKPVTVKMPNPDPVLATAVATPANCYGGNGTVKIKASGGSGVYYLNGKKLPANGETTIDWPNGTPYSFVIRDSNGCMSNEISGTLSGPPELVVNVAPIEPLCNGTGTNTIRVTASGGMPPYSGTGDFKRSSGTYTFTVTDAAGCFGSGTIDILLKDPPPDPLANITDPDCIDLKGTIQVMSPLGTDYKYRFDGGSYQTETVFSGLEPGSSHTIQVLDVTSGCESGITTKTVGPIPDSPQAPKLASTDPDCNEPTGKVAIIGAVTGLQYSFDGAVFGDQIEFAGLLPGSIHTVKARDAVTGCESPETTIAIKAMPENPETPVIVVTTAPTCENLDGTVTVTKPVGAKFMYRLDGGTYQSSPVFSGLKTNDYSIDVLDTSTGCQSTGTVKVPAIPPSPTIVATPVNCACYGGDGRIDFTFTGVPDGIYTITYDDGQFNSVKVTGNRASVVSKAGTYRNLTIEANGCTSLPGVNATIEQPLPISITATITEINLKTNTKGSIALQVNGGTTGYTYLWAPDPANGFIGAATNQISGLGKGTYHVRVTDANGCFRDTTIIMPPPNYPPIAVDDDFSVGCGILNGSLFADNGHGVDHDPENDPLAFDPGLISQPAHGTITLEEQNPGMFRYVADQGFSGIDTFRYVISDPRGNISNRALVTITVIADFDSDGIPDDIDPDADGDGILNVDEALPGQDWRTADTDGDGHPNWLDIDSDNDGIVDNIEAQNGKGPNSVEDPGKPEYVAPSGKDVNHNGIDDAYDPAMGGARLVPVDTDGDGIPDFLDTDSDGDHVPDYIEGNDANHDGIADFVKTGRDSDGDGLDDAYDTVDRCADPLGNITGSRSPLQDTDGDGMRDWRDTNDDNDPYPTQYEDLNGDGDFSNDDTNHNGIPEYLDPVRDCALFVPEAFSPNGDNIHDYFQVYCIEDYPNARMYIFDSYGNKLFQKEHYGNIQYWGSYENAWWDGKTTNRAVATNSNGKVIPGTYFYVLQLGNGEVKKSYVFVSY